MIPKDPRALEWADRAVALRRIQSILWLDYDGWNPDKEWDADTLDGIAQVLIEYGLRPVRAEGATL